MERKTILLAVFAIVSVGIVYATINSFSAQAENRNTIAVELSDSLSIKDKTTTDKQHPLIGQIVFSKDGSTCWEITEKIGALYYKMLETCPNA